MPVTCGAKCALGRQWWLGKLLQCQRLFSKKLSIKFNRFQKRNGRTGKISSSVIIIFLIMEWVKIIFSFSTSFICLISVCISAIISKLDSFFFTTHPPINYFRPSSNTLLGQWLRAAKKCRSDLTNPNFVLTYPCSLAKPAWRPPTSGVTTRRFSGGILKICPAMAPRIPPAPWVPL